VSGAFPFLAPICIKGEFYMESLRDILEQKRELMQEAFYYIDALENEDYSCQEDKEKLEQELEQILKELNIEFNND
jgi:hypothetical protein|tara:strand:- start:245 stop:472 length:228 start_codon:yes stop_codon:yes gene_type:complete